MNTFISLGLSPTFLAALAKQNYIKPYPIQEQVIPAVLKNKDILAIAKTGSGKTASYILPILMNLQKKTVLKNRHIDILVLVPTRELAIQVNDVFKLFGEASPTKVKSLAVHGGSSINRQMQSLQNVKILVATPGRLLDLVKSNAVHLSNIQTLVIDEADKMLDLGFKDEMDRILALLPSKRQNLLFSATLNNEIDKMNRLLLDQPLIIEIESDRDEIELINQIAYYVSDENRGPLLRYLIKSKEMKQLLVFTSSVARADRVADKLRKNGIDAQSIHRKKNQGARNDLLTKFKYGHLPVLVATDLLSRGIDISMLAYVINYELPRSPKVFIHRIGRTGRAESSGEAISLITPSEEHHFRVIQKKMKKRVKIIDGNKFEFRS